MTEYAVRRLTLNTMQMLLTLIDAPNHRATFPQRTSAGTVVYLSRRGWVRPAGRGSGKSGQGGRITIWELAVDFPDELVALMRDLIRTS